MAVERAEGRARVGGRQFLVVNNNLLDHYGADPAPLVYNGTVYLYTSHDEDDATGFHMLNWKLYTSTDMVNWTDHGTIASLATFPWAVQSNDAWAPQVIERNNKFYLYVPISVPGWPKNVIAVAVADSPFGRFKDVLGHPLIGKAMGNIDPTVFIDDDAHWPLGIQRHDYGSGWQVLGKPSGNHRLQGEFLRLWLQLHSQLRTNGHSSRKAVCHCGQVFL
jgi:hypothetical protein